MEDVGSKETRCQAACDCGEQTDKQQKAKCKQSCRDCRKEVAQQVRECKKNGGAARAPAARPRRGAAATPRMAGDSDPKPMAL
ncbi:MAG: hypothetical protein JXP73_20545 [Deltaproteobacteria bacterium]|nr:hypothetical protein [Deltaproteobacteria bacterium]